MGPYSPAFVNVPGNRHDAGMMLSQNVASKDESKRVKKSMAEG